MKVVDFVGMACVKGQQLRVEATNGIFFGKFDKLSMNGCRLDLIEVTDETGKQCGRFKYLFDKDVRAVGSTENGKAELSNIAADEKSHSGSSHFRTSTQLPVCSLSDKQLEHIMKTIKVPVHVHQLGSVYFSALADIYKQLTVGVAADRSQSGRIYAIQNIVISTSNNVYIFNLPSLGVKKTMNDLKELFESANYLKLIYDCRMLLDNLKVKFSIEVESAFDLMLAAAQFHPKNNVSSLAGCIQTVLGVEIDDKLFNDLEKVATLSAFHLAMHQQIMQTNFTQHFHRRFKEFINPSKSFNNFASKFQPSGSIDTDSDVQAVSSGNKEIDFSVYESESATGMPNISGKTQHFHVNLS